jgi:hypothetical protein
VRVWGCGAHAGVCIHAMEATWHTLTLPLPLSAPSSRLLNQSTPHTPTTPCVP